MPNQLLATKSIASLQEQDASGQQLHRALNATQLTLMGIGGIIGTGIFVLTGVAAAQHAGPALALAFVVSGIGCTFAALCYAEFAAMIPVSGSAYSYAYATLGEAVAWFIGWNLVLEYLFAVGTVSVGWSGYALSLLEQNFHIHLPSALTHAPWGPGPGGAGVVTTGAIINLPAILIVAAITTICYIGIKQSAIFNAVIVTIKVTVVLLFILFGMSCIDTGNWHPFIPPAAGPGRFGWPGIMAAAGIIFFAYIGFDAVSTAAQETKNPQRDMPIGIIASLIVCTVLYVVVSLVLTGMVSYTELDVAAPVALAVDRYPALHWFGIPVKIGALAGMTSVMLVMAIAQARIFYAMARDGLLPRWFARVHPRYRTPSTGTIVTGVFAAAMGGLFPVDLLAEVVSIGTLSAFVVVCIGVLVLRYTRPDLPRPFRTPVPWFTCLAGAIVCSALMYSLGIPTWWRLLGWTVIGAIVYATYGYRNSALRGAAAAGARTARAPT